MTEAWAGWHGRHGPMLIAEIGGNHEGDFGYAQELVGLAIEAGADVVKLQVYYADELVNRVESPDRHAHFLRFELEPDQHVALAEMCRAAGVRYLASIWSTGPLGWLDSYLDFYKIGSGDLTSHRLLEQFASRGKPLVLSTGLSTLEEVQVAADVVRAVDMRFADPDWLAVLQCTSVYPLRKSDANLRAMDAISAATGAAAGYSDHTTDGQALRVAAARGARVLEFHFTDDREGKTFRDHHVSLVPTELHELTRDLDGLADLLGDGVKVPLDSEIEAGHVVSFRRGVYFSRDLAAGHVLTDDDLVLLRPAHGEGAPALSSLIGRTLVQDVTSLSRATTAVVTG